MVSFLKLSQIKFSFYSSANHLSLKKKKKKNEKKWPKLFTLSMDIKSSTGDFLFIIIKINAFFFLSVELVCIWLLVIYWEYFIKNVCEEGKQNAHTRTQTQTLNSFL